MLITKERDNCVTHLETSLLTVKIYRFLPIIGTHGYVSSFTYPSHCDTVKPFTNVITENPWHSNLLPCVWKWSCPYMYTCTWFNYIDLSRPGIEHRYPPCKANALQLGNRNRFLFCFQSFIKKWFHLIIEKRHMICILILIYYLLLMRGSPICREEMCCI